MNTIKSITNILGVNKIYSYTNLPYISIILFILVVTLNSIQYSKNDKYLQSLIIDNNKNINIPSTGYKNILLLIYNIIGINGFIRNSITHVLFILFTYVCMAIVEINVGMISLILFIVICFMYTYSINGITKVICDNKINTCESVIQHQPYCCGSFVLFPVLGFLLYIIQKNIHKFPIRIIVWFIIMSVWIGCILYDKYIGFKGLPNTNPTKTCNTLTWHALAFLLGLLSGSGLYHSKLINF